jgi:hypothetical protein
VDGDGNLGQRGRVLPAMVGAEQQVLATAEKVADDCGGGAGGTIDVVLAGTERRRPFFCACGSRGCGVSVNA